MTTLTTMLNEFRLDSFTLEFQPTAIARHHREMVRLTILATYAERDDDALAKLSAEPLFNDWADIYEATASRLEMEAAARAMMSEAQSLTTALEGQRCA